MLDFPDFYAICTEKDERHSSNDEYFRTYEEALNNRMKYANWFCPNGNVWIKKLDGKTLKCLEEWHINEKGEIINYYRR